MEPEFKRVKKTPSKYNLFIYRNKKYRRKYFNP